MKRYTVGFIFNKNLSKVLLIHKLTPEWQRGKVNGLGGKLEAGEDSFECISREVKEESGLLTKPTDWEKAGNLYSQKWSVDVMVLKYSGRENDAKTNEIQFVEWFPVNNLPTNCLNNLVWLIPLCLDKIKNNIIIKFTAESKKHTNE